MTIGKRCANGRQEPLPQPPVPLEQRVMEDERLPVGARVARRGSRARRRDRWPRALKDRGESKLISITPEPHAPSPHRGDDQISPRGRGVRRAHECEQVPARVVRTAPRPSATPPAPEVPERLPVLDRRRSDRFFRRSGVLEGMDDDPFHPARSSSPARGGPAGARGTWRPAPSTADDVLARRDAVAFDRQSRLDRVALAGLDRERAACCRNAPSAAGARRRRRARRGRSDAPSREGTRRSPPR